MYGSGTLGLMFLAILAPAPAGHGATGPVPAVVDTLRTSLAERPAPSVSFDAAIIPRGAVPVERSATAPSTVESALPAYASAPTRDQEPLIEYSDAYYTRLRIHKLASWAILPLFALQYASGQQLADKGYTAPSWARNLHGPAAAGVATLFGVNTVTGVWNLWDSRQDPYGRGWRTAHSVLMLLADAGFVATGALAEDAGEGGSASTHRSVAMASMGVALASWLMMLPPLRRD